MSRGETELSTATKFSFKPDVDLLIVKAIGLLPRLWILEGGELDFLAADIIQFFTNNGLDIFNYAEAKGQKIIKPRHLFMDIAGANKILSGAGRFVLWCGTQSFNKRFRKFHRGIIAYLESDEKEIKGDGVFDNMNEDAGINCTGNLAKGAKDDGNSKDIYPDIPLSMHNGKKERD